MVNTLRLISTHRLDPEKGRDLILGWLKLLWESGVLCSARNDDRGDPLWWRLHYDIYGDGSLRPEIEELAKRYPNQIIYHGYVPLSQVFAQGTDYDFVMMPSHFIETFGLSALDFAQFGVPTIGFKKWGLQQFVSDELDIYQSPGNTLQDKINNLMDRIIEACKQWALWKYAIDKYAIIDKYNFQKWLLNFISITQIRTHEES